MLAVVQNKPLTYYPQVKLIDVIFSRLLVEIVTGFLGLLTVSAILAASGINPIPADPFTAACGYACAMMLGLGIGTINVCIGAVFPAWMMGYMLFSILMYLVSGVMFLPHYLPEQIYSFLKWVPTVQIVEWVRLGYYPDMGVNVDKMYTLMFALAAFVIGMLLEKHYIRRIS